MKKLLFALTAILLSLGAVEAAAATADTEYVCVTQHDGTTLLFSLDSHPVAYPYGEVMCFKTTQQTIDVKLLDMKDVKITTTLPQSIDAVLAEKEHARINHGDVLVSGAEAGSAVSVYDAAGKLVAGGKAAADGTLHLSLSAQPSGVYIVKTAGSTFKIQK